eukprot:snap_masked-scaffold_26-processed-gene-4.98-mRNA-1 protein AED:1.00 eAED:1.00 QI:0/0/0/0/1/1/3/0/425
MLRKLRQNFLKKRTNDSVNFTAEEAKLMATLLLTYIYPDTDKLSIMRASLKAGEAPISDDTWINLDSVSFSKLSLENIEMLSKTDINVLKVLVSNISLRDLRIQSVKITEELMKELFLSIRNLEKEIAVNLLKLQDGKNNKYLFKNFQKYVKIKELKMKKVEFETGFFYIRQFFDKKEQFLKKLDADFNNILFPMFKSLKFSTYKLSLTELNLVYEKPNCESIKIFYALKESNLRYNLLKFSLNTRYLNEENIVFLPLLSSFITNRNEDCVIEIILPSLNNSFSALLFIHTVFLERNYLAGGTQIKMHSIPEKDLVRKRFWRLKVLDRVFKGAENSLILNSFLDSKNSIKQPKLIPKAKPKNKENRIVEIKTNISTLVSNLSNLITFKIAVKTIADTKFLDIRDTKVDPKRRTKQTKIEEIIEES